MHEFGWKPVTRHRHLYWWSVTEHILASIVQFVIWTISSTGYVGVGLLMGIESACIPLPSEIIMPFAGYLVSTGRFGGGDAWMGLIGVATAGAIGCNLGSVVAYWIGAWGGRPLVLRYGKYVLMSAHDLDRMHSFFEKYGSITVLLGRLLPVVRTFIAFPAGIARMPQLRFHVYTFIGSWPWCFVLAYVGKQLGDRWNTDPRFHEWFHRFHLVVELALVAGIVWFVWTHLKRSQRLNEA
jgi:membrane protein DedA with SNARE-associated domain